MHLSKASIQFAMNIHDKYDRLRRRIKIDESKLNGMRFKVAETEEELDEAARLVHDVYVDAGYMRPHPSGMRRGPYCQLPSTTVFIGVCNEDVLLTVSLYTDDRMLDKTRHLSNFDARLGDVEEMQFEPDTLDAACMIHVLNLTPHAKEGKAVKMIAEQLKPGGVFVIADIGRVIDIKKHGLEMFKSAYKAMGPIGLLEFYLSSREAMKLNRDFASFQKSGDYPFHILSDFTAMIESFGFDILEARDDLYLGADDYVVARKN
jgi:SAM-dependent methyltransferase